MGECGKIQPDINGGKAADSMTTVPLPVDNSDTSKRCSAFDSLKKYAWWIQLVLYSFLVLAGVSAGTILGRLYFENGGRSEWLQSLVQAVGFPILFPFQWFQRAKKKEPSEAIRKNPSPAVLALIYITLGFFVAENCMLYSIGLRYLPVTTFTLISASQLGFNAIFSYFINGQKFTAYIVNSIVLLTVSSVLLVFQTSSGDGDSAQTSSKKYLIGFVCTLAASASYALMLSLTQLAFYRVIKTETLRTVVDMSIYQSFVGSMLIIVGLFASGDWMKLPHEMNNYKHGTVSYVMNLFWTAVAWQAFVVGNVGLIFKVSSLFSNVISMLAIPVGPVLAVLVLNDKFSGLKGISMALAMWGFVSYMYQYYGEHLEMKKSSDKEAAEDTATDQTGSV